MTTHELAEGLEQLAAELRERPEIDTQFKENDEYPISLLCYSINKKELLDFAKLGNVRKKYRADEIRLYFGKGKVKLETWANRNKVCKLVRPAEYDCIPLLTPEEEASLEAR